MSPWDARSRTLLVVWDVIEKLSDRFLDQLLHLFGVRPCAVVQ